MEAEAQNREAVKTEQQVVRRKRQGAEATEHRLAIKKKKHPAVRGNRQAALWTLCKHELHGGTSGTHWGMLSTHDRELLQQEVNSCVVYSTANWFGKTMYSEHTSLQTSRSMHASRGTAWADPHASYLEPFQQTHANMHEHLTLNRFSKPMHICTSILP